MSFWDLFEEMEAEMDRMRKHYDRFSLMSDNLRQPLSDIKETSNKIIAEIELPGVNKKDIEINVTENELEVKCESKAKKEEKKKDYYRLERGYSGFYRRFSLPTKVKPNQAKADYKDGLLKISIPKLEVKKPAKKKVKVSVK